jgi:hypothetical protein
MYRISARHLPSAKKFNLLLLATYIRHSRFHAQSISLIWLRERNRHAQILKEREQEACGDNRLKSVSVTFKNLGNRALMTFQPFTVRGSFVNFVSFVARHQLRVRGVMQVARDLLVGSMVAVRNPRGTQVSARVVSQLAVSHPMHIHACESPIILKVTVTLVIYRTLHQLLP